MPQSQVALGDEIHTFEDLPKSAGIRWAVGDPNGLRTSTDACPLLGIEDLHFHDLRHDGISRLFELGWNIRNVAGVLAIAPGTRCAATRAFASAATSTPPGRGWSASASESPLGDN